MKTIAETLKIIADVLMEPEGEVTKKPIPDPLIKPPRRQPAVKNKSNRSDYMKQYMQKYREEGKDYQKMPDKVKEWRREKKKENKEKSDK